MIIAISAGRDSPAELRSRLALNEGAQRELLSQERPGVAEIVLLSTCHRTEVYATADGTQADGVHAVAALLPGLQPTDQHDVRVMEGTEAIEHLFRVASGLDSLVVGEPQVLGQVRRAFVLAEQAGSTGPVLSNVFGRAIRLGKRVRTETPLGHLAGSIGVIAAEYLEDRFGDLKGSPAVVVGAGEAAADAARALWKQGAELSIASRTSSSAQELAELVEGTAHELSDLPRLLSQSKFAVVAVTGGRLLGPDSFPERQEPYLVIDLSVPVAVDVAGRADIDLKTLEDLPGPRGPEITDAVIDAEAMVKREVADLERWAGTRGSGADIQELRRWVEDLVQEEVARATGSLGLTAEQHAKIEMLGMRIANKLIHGPTTAMRRSDDETRAVIRRIFGPTSWNG